MPSNNTGFGPQSWWPERETSKYSVRHASSSEGSYLEVPEVCSRKVGVPAQLDGHDLAHHPGLCAAETPARACLCRGSPSFPECGQVMNLFTGAKDGWPWIPAGAARRSSVPPLLLLLRPRVVVLCQNDALLVTISCSCQVETPPSRGLDAALTSAAMNGDLGECAYSIAACGLAKLCVAEWHDATECPDFENPQGDHG